MHAIQGGSVDQGDKNVVAILINSSSGMSLCTGSLIAPNLVLSAHHCVADVGSISSCGNAFGTTYPASDFMVTTSYNAAATVFNGSGQMPSADNVTWFAVSTVSVPGNNICGQDLSALRLSQSITGICPLIPRVDSQLGDGDTYTAIGFGVTTPNGQVAGTRYKVTGMTVQCVTDCNDPSQSSTEEWLGVASGAKGTCEGDSGGPALDSSSRVIGSVSRGPQGACNQTVYESYYGEGTWIKQVASQAATAGGYAAAGWVTGGATSNAANGYCSTSVDGGVPPQQDAGSGGHDAGSTSGCGTGPACGSGSTCVSGTCVANCGSTGAPCAAGHTCESGACVANCGSTGAPCGTGTTCESGACVANCGSTGAPCASGTTCVNGACVVPIGCGTGPACATGYTCVSGSCVATGCGTGPACTTGYTCVSGSCVAPGGCGTGPACATGYTCVSGSCVAPGGCGTGPACDSGFDCVGGLCVPHLGCGTGPACATGFDCVGGVCMPQAVTGTGATGDPCTANTQCASGVCVDGDTANGYCSQTCTSQNSCPNNASCIEISGRKLCGPTDSAVTSGTTPVQSSGCQAGGGAGSPLGGLGLLLAALGLVLRRRDA